MLDAEGRRVDPAWVSGAQKAVPVPEEKLSTVAFLFGHRLFMPASADGRFSLVRPAVALPRPFSCMLFRLTSMDGALACVVLSKKRRENEIRETINVQRFKKNI